ncbi:hypothetical protein QYH69_08530 [Paraburkholderia sp. SARCC-3016]|uniref:hypothetical protein n=1 Tax=Paraburkholderia sp. SARCC-3016 TaxID=3058611 RepID=UPI002809778D|nr:hypothetical protein [Paraburkholderia sp. SARCC-3016]MDQ7977292.1 hypothetical protein [Paraburkholderia sp. SARCC-3016]
MDEFDNVAAQLGAAHTIAMTKLDLASAEQRRLARESIAGFNPLAQVVDADSVRDRAREAFGDTQADPLHEWTAPSFQRESRRALLHPRVRIFCARSRDTPAWEQTLDWMENISGALGDSLLRMKAIVAGPLGKGRVLLQSVGTTFAQPRRLVAIEASDIAAIFIVRDCGMSDFECLDMGGAIRWTSLQS